MGQRKPLTAAQQFVNLRGNPICRGDGELCVGRLKWCYVANPLAVGRDYDVRIEFEQGGTPQIYVDRPDLHALAGGRRIPHLYQQRPVRLCLYLPRAHEWQSWMRLDQTVIPWTVLWLFYFEEWLISDHWKGGGMHPETDEDHKGAA